MATVMRKPCALEVELLAGYTGALVIFVVELLFLVVGSARRFVVHFCNRDNPPRWEGATPTSRLNTDKSCSTTCWNSSKVLVEIPKSGVESHTPTMPILLFPLLPATELPPVAVR